MKTVYMRTDFSSGRSHIFVRDQVSPPSEHVHAEHLTRAISEQDFWQTFREWRLGGLTLGDNERIAQMLARKRLAPENNCPQRVI